ncbi:MAG: SMP-30/gluconolactonase/LRE family protein [Actinobacteria bacterium]|jgi:sugar lactone lactonase YvrE|nr:SMP-30/gluconolactonase/LRE family protein [Actinomycetota bacterium]MCL5445454.1 SMP-30/gluconolactonase/LRE family protein [Actinomycetota bacterium]
MAVLPGRRAELFASGLYFGECPRWHDGRLWYSDFFDHGVFSLGEAGDCRKEVEFPGEPAGLGWLPDGRLLIVSRLDRSVMRVEPDGSLVTHGTLSPWAGFYGNDMTVSSSGQAYVGNFGFDLDALLEGEPGIGVSTTSLVRIDPDGTSHEAAPDISFPNGTVIWPDGSRLAIAESTASRISVFDLGPGGILSNRRVWADLPGYAPDGICLDLQGCIWVANALGKECVRVAEGGEVVDRVTTEQFCYACMLGGSDRRTLYILTAETSVASVARESREGHVVVSDVDVPGAGLP